MIQKSKFARTGQKNQKKEEKKIIPDRLNKPSKIISEAKKTYKDTYTLKGNYLHHIYQYTGLGLKVSPRSLLWALSVYDSILKELEEIGYKLDFSGNGLEIIKHNIKISVYIYEKKKR